MKKREKTTDAALHQDVPEGCHNGSRLGRVNSMPERHELLDEMVPDKGRAALLHIAASVSALIENADEHRMPRLGHLLRLVKSEAQSLLDKGEIAKR